MRARDVRCRVRRQVFRVDRNGAWTILESTLQQSCGREPAHAAAKHGKVRRSWLFVRDEKVTRHIDSERRSAPRERHATAAVSVVVSKKLAAETLRVDDEAARSIRSQSHDFSNDAITRNVDGRKMTLCVEGQRGARGDQRSTSHRGATQEITSIDCCVHRGADYADLLVSAMWV